MALPSSTPTSPATTIASTAALTASRSWTVEIPAPGNQVWSVNRDHRAPWQARARHRRTARHTAHLVTRAARVPALGRCQVEVTIHLHHWKTADPHNYPGASTLKGALDGLVDAGVAPSDRAEHMQVQMPVLAPLGGKGKQPRLLLTITPLPQPPAAAASTAEGTR